VESLDRLSRQDVDIALSMFLDLTRAGITIVSLMDNQTYTHPVDTIKLITSILILSRANEESVTKSKRVCAAWQKKRDSIDAKNLTARYPAWLIPRADRKGFDVDKKRAAVIRRIFHDAADRGMGTDLISRRLNEEKVPTFTESNGWHKSYVYKILTTKAVLGNSSPD
jgi:DNA invertase Pin-like site-specific DNA recombinase